MNLLSHIVYQKSSVMFNCGILVEEMFLFQSLLPVMIPLKVITLVDQLQEERRASLDGSVVERIEQAGTSWPEKPTVGEQLVKGTNGWGEIE